MTAASSQADLPDSSPLPDNSPCSCVYCGLPVAVNPRHVAADDDLYCCYGCRFAHAVVQERGEEGAIRWTVVRLGLAIFFTMNLMAFTMTMWSLDVYDVDPDPFQQKLYEVFRWLSMLLAAPVLLLLGIPLLQNSIDSWRRRVLSTDLLIGVAVIAAYAMSAYSVISDGTAGLYFEVGAMVLVMMTLGRWIEAAGRHKATEALDQLLTLLPDQVTRVNPATGTEDSIPSEQIRQGDLIRIRAGERIPMDAVVRQGQTTVDEQTFTGESRPIPRQIGDALLAGTVNLDGDISAEVTAEFRQGSFGRLLLTLQQARDARGHYQRLADRVATWFFPAVTGIALLAFLMQLDSGIPAATQTAMSVLLIACPCALGLATPLAVWTALSTAIRRQVLFRSGEALERLAMTQAVCLDKTGTVTTGTPQVSEVVVCPQAATAISWPTIDQLASASLHPFSRAIAEYAALQTGPTDNTPKLHQDSIRTTPGSGIEGMHPNGQLLRLGRVAWAVCAGDNPSDGTDPADEEWLQQIQQQADRQRVSLTIVTADSRPLAGFLMTESVRPEAVKALRQLSDDDLSLQILSGDRPDKAAALQTELQISKLSVEGGLKPDQKVERIREIRAAAGTTVMVGDGINDAPALAASDVGIAMGCGADVSRDSADVCLLGNDLQRIPWAIDLARRTRSIIRQNLMWAFGYNGIGVAVAALGWLNPAIAAGLMIASSLLVISNSLRLLQSDSLSAVPETEAPA